MPGSHLLMISSVEMVALMGMPPAMALPQFMTSGTTPKFSLANILPVRPQPDWISSKMSRMPYLSQRSRTPSTKDLGGTK